MLGAASIFIVIFVLILVGILVFEVWMFVDAVRNPRLTDVQRLLWCIGMLLIHPIVALVYYVVEYNKPKV